MIAVKEPYCAEVEDNFSFKGRGYSFTRAMKLSNSNKKKSKKSDHLEFFYFNISWALQMD